MGIVVGRLVDLVVGDTACLSLPEDSHVRWMTFCEVGGEEVICEEYFLSILPFIAIIQ